MQTMTQDAVIRLNLYNWHKAKLQTPERLLKERRQLQAFEAWQVERQGETQRRREARLHKDAGPVNLNPVAWSLQ